MNLYVILLLLAIQGLVPSSCEGQSGEEVSGEGPWEEEDWGGSSDSSTDEGDNFTGFDSGSSSADKGRDDEGPRTFPKISQTYSNKRFITSGVGEDKGGSQGEGSSDSKSNSNQDQGSADENLESNTDLTKIGDAIDVMKKLKKAKSDQEFAKKLRSGPESLGVAFKTFEQLSGLWISVMHRIWRVWKAKGAKVVMHSIVHDLLNKTGGAITRKVGKLLKKKIVVNLNGSGSAAFKDEGSTEPEQNLHQATINNQTALSVQQVSIDFIKNNSKEARAFPSKKTAKDPVEKVKVSFFGKNVNDSKAIQKSAIQRKPSQFSGKSNDTLGSKKTPANKGKTTIIDKNEKTNRAVETNSTAALNVKSTTSSAKESKRIPNNDNRTLESSENKEHAPNISMGDIGNSIQRNVSHNVTETTHKVTQNLNNNNIEREKNNATEKLNRDDRVPYNVSSSVTKSQSEVTHAQDKKVKQTSAEHGKQATQQFDESKKVSSINTEDENKQSSVTQIKNDTQENAKIPERKNVAINKTGKTRVLETLKINFLKKNRTWNFDQNNSSVTRISDLKTPRNLELPALQTEPNSKTDSGKVVALSKLSPASGSDKTGSNVLDKKISTVNKSDVMRKRTDNKHGVQDSKGLSTNKGLDKDTKTRTTTSGKSEKIIVKLNSKQETPKENKRNTSVNFASRMNDEEANGVDKRKTSQREETSTFSLQNKTKTMETDSVVNSAQVTVKSITVQNKERKMNISSTNNSSKGDGSKGFRISTSVEHDQKQLQTLKQSSEASPHTKSSAEDSSNRNKTVAKVNTHVTTSKGTSSEIESKNSQSDDGSSEGNVDKNVTQPVERVADKKDTKEFEENRSQESMETVLTTNTSNATIAELSQKLERSNHSEGSTSNVEEKRLKHVQEGVESLNVQKDQSNIESRHLQDKNNTEIDTNLKIIKPSENAATSLLVKTSSPKGSENHLKVIETPHENSFKANGKEHKISPKKAIASNNDKSENGVTHARESVTHGQQIGATHDPGSGVTDDPQNDVTDKVGSGVRPASEISVTHSPGSNSTHAPRNVSTASIVDTTKQHSKRVSEQVQKSPKRVSDSTHKHTSQHKKVSSKSTQKPTRTDLENTTSSNTPHTNNAKTVHFKKAKTPAKPKDVTQASRRTKEEERPQSIRAKTSHHTADHENTKSSDQPQPTEMESTSSRTEPNLVYPTKEDIKPSKSQQVDVLTSRTPPTSLLTTSNDDNTYSIKQIVQGPKGSSYVYENHDDEKVRRLEKKVSKLESEVTVLETAMADLAKRLLVVEQKSEVPKPTAAAIFLPPTKEPEPRVQHPVHHQQQTTVYVAKDLGETPQTPVPQYGPNKIVIPISSLYPGGASGVSIPSTTVHVKAEHHEAKVDNFTNEEDQKPQDSTHVTLRDGSRSSPSSEAHGVVRPIVNIIVPNNRADLLSEGAMCIPRCQNGGRCLDRNICRCPTFFTGDHCERFSLRDLLESPPPRERPYRKLQRIVVSEPPDRQVLDGTLNLDPGSPALEYRDLNQDLEAGKDYVAKQQPVEVTSPSNSAEVDSGARRRQLILEI